jgi:threonine/homoserine/homoserine lactone efflux protein
VNADLLPLALAIAASPFPIIPAILLLFTPHPRRTAGAFLVGWIVGIAGVVVLFMALGSAFDSGEQTPTWLAWTRVGIGAFLIGFGVRLWLTRKSKNSTPSWMQAIESSTPRKAARLGLLLSAANPKIVVLAAAAGVAIGTDDLASDETVVAVAVFTLIASCTVALPLVVYLCLGDRMLAPLRTAKDWLSTHNAAVMAVVITLIGVYLLLAGINQL